MIRRVRLLKFSLTIIVFFLILTATYGWDSPSNRNRQRPTHEHATSHDACGGRIVQNRSLQPIERMPSDICAETSPQSKKSPTLISLPFSLFHIRFFFDMKSYLARWLGPITLALRASFMVTPACGCLNPPDHQLLVAGPTIIIAACGSEIWPASDRAKIIVVIPQNVLSPACCWHFTTRSLPSLSLPSLSYFALFHIGIAPVFRRWR
jgi:hypothetical protein